jgi:cytochrome c biogenesis protein CcmG/thiol:disulfide interchange protein DsbE
MVRYVVPITIFCLLGAFLNRGLYLSPGEIESPLVGQPAPEISLPDLKNPTLRIDRADLMGGFDGRRRDRLGNLRRP